MGFLKSCVQFLALPSLLTEQNFDCLVLRPRQGEESPQKATCGTGPADPAGDKQSAFRQLTIQGMPPLYLGSISTHIGCDEGSTPLYLPVRTVVLSLGCTWNPWGSCKHSATPCPPEADFTGRGVTPAMGIFFFFFSIPRVIRVSSQV